MACSLPTWAGAAAGLVAVGVHGLFEEEESGSGRPCPGRSSRRRGPVRSSGIGRERGRSDGRASTGPSSGAALAAGAVDVWRVPLDGAPVEAVPSEDEERRAGRMLAEGGRARFLASRAWLRLILGGYLGVDAAAVRYRAAEGGKPSVVDGGDLGFSLSRSAALALVAVTRGRAVGVDVEWVRADLDHDGLAEQFFSPGEAGSLRGLPGPDRQEAFFRLWVRKEAVVKASGAGLTPGIDHLDVRGDTVGGRWWLASLDAGPGYAAALAVDGPLGPVSVLDRPARG